MERYDAIIIGGGPAGIAAAIYGSRYKIKLAIIARELGGTATTAYKICNYPSYTEISGIDLMQKMVEQVKALNVPVFLESVNSIQKTADGFSIMTDNNREYRSNAVILATGLERKRLDIPGEKEYLSKGVSYCATCDSGFFKNRIVGVVGGSDAALSSAMLVSEYAKKVYLIYRGEEFMKAEPYWVDLVEKNPKIEVLFNEEVSEIIGETNVKSLKLKSGKELTVEGVFIEIGSVSNIEFLRELGVKDNKGHIIVDKGQQTNITGLYAAGDVTNNNLKQIITASAEGAVASLSVYKALLKLKQTRGVEKQ